MLTSLILQNFKSHQLTVTKLDPLTILVGANASGKSSILDALDWSAFIFNSRTPHNDARLEACRRVGAEKLQVKLESEQLGIQTWAYPPDVPKNTAIAAPRIPHPIGKFVGTAELVRFEFMQLASATPISTEPPELQCNGQNLAGVLAYLRLSNDEIFEKIVADLQGVVPSFRKVRLQRGTAVHEEKSVAADHLFLDFVGASSIPAEQVSEGTLMALGLLTLIQGPARPRLILIDDIDRGLHPKAQTDLMRTIRKMIDTIDGLQIIATTHSPFVVDAVAPESVRVLALKPDGTTAVKALTDHPGAAKALEVLTAGELWSAEGEDWVARSTNEP